MLLNLAFGAEIGLGEMEGLERVRADVRACRRTEEKGKGKGTSNTHLVCLVGTRVSVLPALLFAAAFAPAAFFSAVDVSAGLPFVS